MRAMLRLRWGWAAVSIITLMLSVGSHVSGQTTDTTQVGSSSSSSSPPALPSSLQTLRQQQAVLSTQMVALINQGATAQQFAAWRQQNSNLLQALQAQGQALIAATPSQPISYISTVNVPDNATQQMSDFVTTRADLFNRYAQLHNQLLQGGAAATSTTNEAVLFQQQNAAEIQTLQSLALAVAAQSAQQPLPTPPPLRIPPGSGAQLRAFLTQRDELFRERIKVWNSNVTAAPSVQQAAMQQWDQQNAARVQQVQQMAQTLSQANASSN